MRYFIRCPKVNYEWSGVEYPWNDPNYLEFADHIDPSINGDDKSVDTAFGDRLWWWNAGYNAARYYNFDCRLQFLYHTLHILEWILYIYCSWQHCLKTSEKL